MRYPNSSLLAMATALMLVGFGGANATAQTFQVPANQSPTDQAPGAKSDITRVQAGSDTSGVVSGQAKSDEPSMGAGSKQLPSPNSEDQGGTGIKGSAQSEGATNKDTAPRDSQPE
jgi:hypothetical protein